MYKGFSLTCPLNASIIVAKDTIGYDNANERFGIQRKDEEI